MTAKELVGSLAYRLKGFFKNDEEEPQLTEPNLTSGGYSGYRPGRGDIFSNDSLQRKDAQTASAQTNNSYPQDVPQYGQGGFGDPAQQNRGYDDQQNGYGGNQGYAQQMDYGYQQAQNEPYPQEQDAAPSNISYLPNQFIGDDGRAYAHCERVMQVNSLNACFRVIDCMRNRESVVISAEAIGNEDEVRRCIDIINGAAYTMQCSMTRVSQLQRIYLVAPNSIMVVQDAAVSHWADHDTPQPWQVEPTPYVQVPPRQVYYEPSMQNEPAAGGYREQRAESGYAAQPQQNAEMADRTDYRTAAASGQYYSDTRKGVYANPVPQMGFGGR